MRRRKLMAILLAASMMLQPCSTFISAADSELKAAEGTGQTDSDTNDPEDAQTPKEETPLPEEKETEDQQPGTGSEETEPKEDVDSPEDEIPKGGGYERLSNERFR